MRHFLISALLLSLVAGCSSFKIGPHRIDVQQGNAIDQENVARLKVGLNRSQVRFLMGTPLLVDPFRTDRWDYVYVSYKAGRLAEQKHITLFFDGDTLARIEGDVPPQPVAPQSAATIVQPESKVETQGLPDASVPKPAPEPAASHAADTPVPSVSANPAMSTGKPEATASAATAVGAATQAAEVPEKPAAKTSMAETSIVSPLPAPDSPPAPKGSDFTQPRVEPSPTGKLSLQAESDAEKIKPDVIPTFPGATPVVGANDAPVLKALDAWSSAWSHRDVEAYLAAYDIDFVPEGGDNRSDWEKRRRLLLNVARNIELKISSPSVDWASDGSATVTFNQSYRSEIYHDDVVKQLHMVERNGRWLIVGEKVLSILHGSKP